MARPTSCTQEHVDKGREYIEGGYLEQGQVIPTAEGLAIYLDVSRATPYNWAKQEDNPFADDFAYIVDRVQAIQGMKLVNGGLTKDFDPGFCKTLVGNHGYGEKHAIDHSSSDGSMSPTRIELVAADDDSEG